MEKNIVKNLAETAKFELTEEEFAAAGAKLDEIIKNISALDKFKVPDINLFDQTVGIDILRADTPRPSLSIEEVKKNAPLMHDRYFAVPKMME